VCDGEPGSDFIIRSNLAPRPTILNLQILFAPSERAFDFDVLFVSDHFSSGRAEEKWSKILLLLCFWEI
jgi:hypothetical protein